MGKTSITKEKVFMAADMLASMGKNVNAATIRAYLGNVGSNSTIQPFLDEWHIEREGKSCRLLEMPTEFHQIAIINATGMWKEFNRLSVEQFQIAHEGSARKSARDEAEVADTWALVQDLEQSLDLERAERETAEFRAKALEMSLAEALGREKQMLADCKNQIDDAKLELSIQQQKYEVLRMELADLRSQLAVEQNHIAWLEQGLERERAKFDELQCIVANAASGKDGVAAKLPEKN